MDVRGLLPLVDPRKAMTAPLDRLSDRGRDSGRLKPIQRGFAALIVAGARAAANERQNLIGRRGRTGSWRQFHEARHVLWRDLESDCRPMRIWAMCAKVLVEVLELRRQNDRLDSGRLRAID